MPATDEPKVPPGFTAISSDNPHFSEILTDMCGEVALKAALAADDLFLPPISLRSFIDVMEKYFEDEDYDPNNKDQHLMHDALEFARAQLAFVQEVERIARNNPDFLEWQMRRKGANGQN